MPQRQNILDILDDIQKSQAPPPAPRPSILDMLDEVQQAKPARPAPMQAQGVTTSSRVIQPPAPPVPVTGRGTGLDVRKSDESIFAEPFKGIGEAITGARDVATSLFTPPSQRGTPPTPDLPENPLAAAGDVQLTPLPTATKRAISDTSEGIFKAGSPAVAAALLVNPVAVAIGLGLATGADKAAQDAVRLAGGDAESQRLAGNVAALLAAGAAGKGTDYVIRQFKADMSSLAERGRTAKARREAVPRVTPEPSDITLVPDRLQLPAKTEPEAIRGTPTAPVPPAAPILDVLNEVQGRAPAVEAPETPVVSSLPGEVLPLTSAPGLPPVTVPESPGGQTSAKADAIALPPSRGEAALEQMMDAIHGEDWRPKGNGTFQEPKKEETPEVVDLTPPKKEREEHSFSSTQVNLPQEHADAILAMAKTIPDKDLSPDGRAGDSEATAPHVTVKYGLHTADVEKVRDVLKDEPPVTVTLGKTSLFQNDEHDVLKVDVDSPDLHRLNATIAKALKTTDTFPDYRPHVTIAYLKPGKGKDYLGDETLSGRTMTIDALRFSTKDGKIYEIPLTGQQTGAAPLTYAPLQRELSGAKPRYANGTSAWEPTFSNDVDRAAFVIAQRVPSKRDADYLRYVMQQTGRSEAGARALGQQVHSAVKAATTSAKEGTNAKPAPLAVGPVWDGERSQVTPSVPPSIQGLIDRKVGDVRSGRLATKAPATDRGTATAAHQPDQRVERLADVQRRLKEYALGRAAAIERIRTGEDPSAARTSLARIDDEIKGLRRDERSLTVSLRARPAVDVPSSSAASEGKPQRLAAKKIQLSIRPLQRGDVAGYSIVGRDSAGRQISIFTRTRESAEHIKAKKLANEDAEITTNDFAIGQQKVGETQTGGRNASVGSYAQHAQETLPAIAAPQLPPPPVPNSPSSGVARPAEFPELVDLARQLQGVPQVRRSLGKNRGVFTAGGIRLVADLFKPGNEYQLAATLAHEIGHLVDFLPDRTLKRGNILGRLRSLQSFLKGTFTTPDGTAIKNKDVKTELQALSDEWRPWNPETASASFRAYRRSSKELYADAISVLLNNPGLLKAKAPIFYGEFFAALDAKADVQRAYFDLQEVLSGTPEELVARRRSGVRRMFEQGDVTALELERRRIAEKDARNSNLWFRLKVQHLDKNYPFIDRVHELEKQGVVVPEAVNPVYFLEERNYVGGKLKAFTERVFAPIFKAITDADIHWNAFSEALFYERIIAGDRSELANPRGLSPATAGELYESLKTELGPVKTAVIRHAATDFRAAVKGVAEDAYKAGLYTDDLHTQMQENPAYVTFQVIDHMDNAITSRVRHQIGTLKDVANVADSTILKTLVTLRAIEHQKVKQAAFNFLKEHFLTDIEPAKTVWSGKGQRPIEPKDANQRLVTYFEDGKLKGYYVDRYIADSLNNESIGHNLAVVSILRRLNSGIFRPVFTTFNLGFQSFNFARDFERFWKNTPGMTLKRVVQRYWQAVPLARIRAFGVGNDLTTKQIQAHQDMLAAEESKMLSVTMNDLVTGRQVEDSQIEDILTRVGVGGFGQRSRLWFTKPFLAALDLIRELGDFIETLPKAAGIYEYKGSGSIADIPAGTRSFIRRKVGSPDFLMKGTATPITNEVFLFSNAAAQAIRADFEVATDSKTRSGWWWKTAKATLLPKLLMAAALAGLMGEEIRRLLERASEYDRTNYTVLPLGDDGKGNAVYVRMPQDQTSQLIGGVFWKFLQLFRRDAEVLQSLGQVADYTAGQIPSVAPGISAAGTATQLVSGQNPYDSFRGRNLFTDDEWRARDRHTFMKFIGWEFQQLGGGIVWKFFPGEERPKTQTRGQRILDFPIVSNIIGRFLRVTNYGDTEAFRAAQGLAQRDEARRRLTETERANEAIRDYMKLPQDQRTTSTVTRLAAAITRDLYKDDPQEAAERFPELKAKLTRGVVRGEADPFMDAILSAGSKAQKIAILRAWLKRKPTNASK